MDVKLVQALRYLLINGSGSILISNLNSQIKIKLDRGSIRSSLRNSVGTITITPPWSYSHWRPRLCPSCNEFVFPGCWYFDNGMIKKENY